MTKLPGEAPSAIDALLAGYAAGSLSAPLHALVAGHLAISPKNRAFVAALEAARGAEIDSIAPLAIERRDEKLAAIFATEPEPSAGARADSVFPAAIERYVGLSVREVPWKTRLPGIREYRVKSEPGVETALYWIRRGRNLPAHTHEGTEYTLILQGGLHDITGNYRRGDIEIADSEVDHRPIADDDEDCICFTVIDAPVRLTGPIGRWIQRLVR